MIRTAPRDPQVFSLDGGRCYTDRVFRALDYGVLAGYFGLCALVGWWTGRGQKDSADYFKGGGRMPVWAVCLSILASEMSALTFCSVPGLAFRGDLTYFQFVIGNFFGRLLVAFLFIPAFYTAGVTSVYEFLGMRFGPRTRGLASLLFFVTRILASGVRLTAAAIAVQVVTGWAFGKCVVGFTGLTVLYTVYGGIKSIIWTDVLQFFLFVGGAALALFLILGDGAVGGLSGVLSAASPEHKLRLIDDQDGNDRCLCGIVEGPKHLTQHEKLPRVLALSNLLEWCAKGTLLLKHVALLIAVPGVEHIVKCEVLHPLEVKDG